MKKRFSTWIRLIRNLRRPSGAANLRRLDAQGMDSAHVVIREAGPSDAEAIARVHVQAFAETHGSINPPTFALRHRQWSELLRQTDRSCYLAENENGEAIGFASGNRYADAALPAYDGQLNKIYVLRTYQRLGIGRRLLPTVARRLHDDGVQAMLLFGEAENPSCFFYEKNGRNTVAGSRRVVSRWLWLAVAFLPAALDCFQIISSGRNHSLCVLPLPTRGILSMKAIVAVFLTCWTLAGSFVPGMGVDQSAYLGELTRHFQEHRHTDASLSFLDFLLMHYGADSEHHKHPNHSHQNLPSPSHSVPVFPPVAQSWNLPPAAAAALIPRADFFRKADLYSFLSVFALINPPRGN